MIASVIETATTKLASDQGNKKVRNLLAYEKKEHGHIPTPSEEEAEKTAGFDLTDPSYIEKLASTVDQIAANVDNIDVRPSALKQASEGSAVGAGKGPGALEVSQAIGGQQSHKKDHSKTHDASKSTADSPLSAGGLPGGKTQMENDMHHAPGGGSVAPTAKYPTEGVFRTKSATDRYAAVIAKTAAEIRGAQAPVVREQAPAVKTAGDKLRAAVMSKLAGEDVMKANISSSKDGGPLPGDGGLKVMQSGENASGESGNAGSGGGNSARSNIASNKSAIDTTKADAKGPQKTMLGEVLDEPALSKSTDSVLRNNLRNASSAGVKIAAVAALKKIASEGCKCDGKGECASCQLKSKVAAAKSKQANAMMGYGGGGGMGQAGGGAMGGGMSATADAGAGADGCTCGNTGACRVCMLKAALAAAKAGGGAPMAGGGVPQGAPEKDSTMGGSAPVGGQY
jgi:hypothetical protein